MHVPRLPLRPPTQLDSRHRPETAKHKRLHEHFGFDARHVRRVANLGQRQFPRQHNARRPKPGRSRHVGAVGTARLRAEVELQARKLGLHRQQGRIADQYSIDAGLLSQLQQPGRLSQLAFGQVDVQGQVGFGPVLVGRLHGLRELGLVEIACPPPRVQDIQAEINGVSAGRQSGLQGGKIACGASNSRCVGKASAAFMDSTPAFGVASDSGVCIAELASKVTFRP